MASTGAVRSVVRETVAAVNAAPGVGAGTKAAVSATAQDVLGNVRRCEGQNFAGFRGASLSIGLAGCGSAKATIEVKNSQVKAPEGSERWFVEVGITPRERADAARERTHFANVGKVGSQIRKCCTAIERIRDTMCRAVPLLIKPAKAFLELILKFGITKLIPFAVELVFKALSWALDLILDGNDAIETCLDGIEKCVKDVADKKPEAPVTYGDKCKEPGTKKPDTKQPETKQPENKQPSPPVAPKVAPPPAPTPQPAPEVRPQPRPTPTVTLPPAVGPTGGAPQPVPSAPAPAAPTPVPVVPDPVVPAPAPPTTVAPAAPAVPANDNLFHVPVVTPAEPVPAQTPITAPAAAEPVTVAPPPAAPLPAATPTAVPPPAVGGTIAAPTLPAGTGAFEVPKVTDVAQPPARPTVPDTPPAPQPIDRLCRCVPVETPKSGLPEKASTPAAVPGTASAETPRRIEPATQETTATVPPAPEASGTEGKQGKSLSFTIAFDFGLELTVNAPLDALGYDTAEAIKPASSPSVTAKLMLGPLGEAGAAAVQGGIEHLRNLLREVVACPGAECATHTAPPPAAPAPMQPAPTQPAGAPPAGGVTPPPPELAKVEEPAPPPKKGAAAPAAAAPAASPGAAGAGPAPSASTGGGGGGGSAPAPAAPPPPPATQPSGGPGHRPAVKIEATQSVKAWGMRKLGDW